MGFHNSSFECFPTTDTSIQRKTSIIPREELSYYEELVRTQEATIANLQAMLQRERLEHKHEMEVAKKGFERLQEVAVIAVDTPETMKACKVEHKPKEK